MKEVLKTIKAVSEEIRIQILILLVDKEACVCELMEVFNLPQSKLSHHLITLRNAGFLSDEKRGKWNYYKVETVKLNKLNKDLLGYLSSVLAEDEIVKRNKKKLEKIQKQDVVC